MTDEWGREGVFLLGSPEPEMSANVLGGPASLHFMAPMGCPRPGGHLPGASLLNILFLHLSTNTDAPLVLPVTVCLFCPEFFSDELSLSLSLLLTEIFSFNWIFFPDSTAPVHPLLSQLNFSLCSWGHFSSVLSPTNVISVLSGIIILPNVVGILGSLLLLTVTESLRLRYLSTHSQI